MELRQLGYFVAVAEERHFTRAAARLQVVQSAVSAGVRALERELGAALVDRATSPVSLTEAGAALLPHARAALDAADEARDAVHEVRGGLRGTLRVGTLTSVALVDLPAALGAFHRRHPGVELRLTAAAAGSRGLVEALAERRLDLALVSIPGPTPPGLRLLPLAAAPLELVVREDHPLAGRSAVTLADLDGADVVDFPPGYGNRAVTDRAFDAAGLRRHVVVEISDLRTGAAFIREGLGVGLLPAFVLDDPRGLRRVPVTGADLVWPLQLAVPADRPVGRAARALVELLVAAARSTADVPHDRPDATRATPG
ncbi:LysR family transcriptional regulator [Cellulomonas marina]|uniref:DNA-binding transcriptional regulator, LysR family n=1 Tax=Cellulomonas marina TaxID=988821 RepID=A0A1I0WUJ5_9CELL|nr:LysR substrate-binding domain-containing protein [Cellulomonas marina]GIG30359.1 LysR family transcriptional regulator [Cellulomonas marina]SFA92415.1 DNA-binding transcriptional regulator, LysR family [Cellulomonas marina]